METKNIMIVGVGGQGTLLASRILGQLEVNLQIAAEESIPICQDTGMAVVFLKIGQDVHFFDGDFTEAVKDCVRRGYT